MRRLIVQQFNCWTIRVNAHAKVKPAYIQRPAIGSNFCVFRLHVARHLSAPFEIRPRGEHFDHAIGCALPDESVWAGGTLFQRGRCIEDRFDGLVEEVEGSEVFSQF